MNPLTQWFIPAIGFGVTLFLYWATHKILTRKISKWTPDSGRFSNSAVLDVIRAPVRVLGLILACAIAVSIAPESVQKHPISLIGIKVSLILIGLWIMDRSGSALVKSDLLPDSVSSGTRSWMVMIFRGVVYSVGTLILLDAFGISITPILASLGVGSVAIALALQETLGHFFSGLYLMADQPLRIGDFIRLEDGVEGTVTRGGGRSTNILTPADNLIVLPNTKVANSRLTNFDLPSPETNVHIDLGVAYGSDLDRVEKVTLIVAKNILTSSPSGVSSSTPSFRFVKFGESSIDLTVTLRARTYAEGGALRHDFIKMLHREFEKEKISIPYPHRVIQTMST